MIVAEWFETINGIVKGLTNPEKMPFALLDSEDQAAIIDEIDAASEDIRADVLEQYPDLDDEAQRIARLKLYREEYLSRKNNSDRAIYASYFDTIMGVVLRDANLPRSYTIDDSGVVEELVAA